MRVFFYLYRIEEAQVKYINREPREADLQTIASLNTQLTILRKHIEELNVRETFFLCKLIHSSVKSATTLWR